MASRHSQAETVGRRLGIDPLAAQVLLNRGIASESAARDFLNPELTHLHDPACAPEFLAAARKINEAAKAGRKITVYGDYDVDGMSAIAILLRCLSLFGANCDYYVPDRFEEGYGLNENAIAKLAKAGTQLLVTVDCGITAAAEVSRAREAGMDVIITDHHEPAEVVPSGAILINPKLPTSLYPFRDLAGAGIAFKLAWALGHEAGIDKTAEFTRFFTGAISLAALGTIADVASLHGENRTLAYFGIRGIGSDIIPGISALIESAGIRGRKLSAEDVAFKLAPRLNAAGRMGSADQAVELLITSSAERAAEIASKLNSENNRRRKVQELIFAETEEMISSFGGCDKLGSIVLAQNGWHPGVIGIVAAQLAEKYWKPTILVSLDGELGHGSCRSIAPVDIFDCLRECTGSLLRYGGHARAAGIQLRKSDFETFKRKFDEAACLRLAEKDSKPFIEVDAAVSLDEITRPLIDDFDKLAPFGEGNRAPLLAAFDLQAPAGAKYTGDGKHLTFWVRQNEKAFRAIAFNMGGLADELNAEKRCSIVFAPSLDHYNGDTTLQLEVRDVRMG